VYPDARTKTGFLDASTGKETGFLDVVSGLEPLTPFGKRLASDIRPFMPGEEAALEAELDLLQGACAMLSGEAGAERVMDAMRGMKDISLTLGQCGGRVLSVVELFETKALLLGMETLRGLCEGMGGAVPGGFAPEDMGGLLDALDPDGGRMPAFYIYDMFSVRLAELRRERKGLDLLLRAGRKRLAAELLAASGISLGPRFETSIARSDEAALEAARSAPQLYTAGEDLFSVSFALSDDEEGRGLALRMDALSLEIEDEEHEVRKALTAKVASEAARILESCERVGRLDFLMAKARHALANGCVRPAIPRGHTLRIEDGRHLGTERALRGRGLEYRPVSLSLGRGVACITGANMGGKTVAVKMAGLVAAMAQHGFFVPCVSAAVGLSSSISMLIGDSQDIGKGLSSFGGEIEGLRAALSGSGGRAMLLIDEIAGSTNPSEGGALTKGLIAYLLKRPYICLMTTHFDGVAAMDGVVGYRTRGLSGTDPEALAAALGEAKPGDRLRTLSGLMDYRLERTSGEAGIPRDAIRIAEILGLDREIVEFAKDSLDSAARRIQGH
jgi:hypothetical protein